MAAMSEAKKKANKKWNDANLKTKYDRVQLVLPAGEKAFLTDYAKRCNMSVNAFIREAIKVFIEIDQDQDRIQRAAEENIPETLKKQMEREGKKQNANK